MKLTERMNKIEQLEKELLDQLAELNIDLSPEIRLSIDQNRGELAGKDQEALNQAKVLWYALKSNLLIFQQRRKQMKSIIS